MSIGIADIRRKALLMVSRVAYRRTVRLAAPMPPTISLTFDDFPKNAALLAAPLLEAAGVRGTFFASVGLAGRDADVGRIASREDIVDLRRRGHEIGCHSFSHVSAERVGAAVYAREIRANREALSDLLPGDPVQAFAYPYGKVTPRAKAAALATYACCRSIRPGIEGRVIDLGLLHGNMLYSEGIAFPAIRDLIRRCGSEGGWLTFFTHDVSPAPTEYGCTPAYLAATLDEAARAGCRIRPLGQVAAELLGAAGRAG
ncbi:MAG TPA: polysaccharide deacetylase family protein [Azospirillum sp.]|nr:polysaccharide deacetylase family protein [Azospirillum sp.]